MNNTQNPSSFWRIAVNCWEIEIFFYVLVDSFIFFSFWKKFWPKFFVKKNEKKNWKEKTKEIKKEIKKEMKEKESILLSNDKKEIAWWYDINTVIMIPYQIKQLNE